MTTLREEIQKIILITAARLDAKKAAPVNSKTALNLQKIFNQSRSKSNHN